MLVVFGFALLVVVAAIVVLFAMLAELASRVPARTGDGWARPLEEARIGYAPDVWPAELVPQDGAGPHTVLVLSTVCGSCRTIAGALRDGGSRWAGMAVVVSTATQRNGDGFVAEFGLGRFRHWVDEGGEWVSSQFGVQVSPTALVFRHGRLASAYSFTDLAALESTIDREGEPTEQREAAV